MRNDITKTHSIGRLFSCLIFLFLIGCNRREPVQHWQPTAADTLKLQREIHDGYVEINKLLPTLHNGDIVTREGNDFTSQGLKSLNQRDRTYSHIGIISVEKDSVFVYHALGGQWNPDEKLMRENILSFADPYSNNKLGFFRFNINNDSIENVVRLTKDWYKKGLQFDMDFDLSTKDKMYCAEFVYNAFQDGTHELLSFPLSQLKNFTFVGVDDIFLHHACSSIAQISYRKTYDK